MSWKDAALEHRNNSVRHTLPCILYSIISIKTSIVLLSCNNNHMYDNLFHGMFKAFFMFYTLLPKSGSTSFICLSFAYCDSSVKSMIVECPV